MDENEREIIRIKTRRQKVTKYLRKHKNALNIRNMERTLGFHKGKIQKFAVGIGNLKDEQIQILYDYLKKLTRF